MLNVCDVVDLVMIEVSLWDLEYGGVNGFEFQENSQDVELKLDEKVLLQSLYLLVKESFVYQFYDFFLVVFGFLYIGKM